MRLEIDQICCFDASRRKQYKQHNCYGTFKYCQVHDLFVTLTYTPHIKKGEPAHAVHFLKNTESTRAAKKQIFNFKLRLQTEEDQIYLGR